MSPPREAIPKRQLWKVIAASGVGTMIEWYDFYIFGSLAMIIAPLFYPSGNDSLALIAYLSTFAVGFVVRPFGALFFGRIGDRVGRKYAFVVTLVIMGGATAVVGVLPTYETIGMAAPIALLLIRVLQGLALGGEYGGAAVYVAEHVPDGKRGFYTSFIQITATLGLFLSLIVILFVQNLLGPDAFKAWGWRVPFLISIFLVAISLSPQDGVRAYAPREGTFGSAYIMEKLDGHSGWSTPMPDEDESSGHRGLVQHVADCLRSHQATDCDGRLGAEVVRVVYEAYRSAAAAV